MAKEQMMISVANFAMLEAKEVSYRHILRGISFVVKPGELAVYGGWEPDFNAQTGEWIADSSIYGVMRMSCYESADKQMSYTFCRDTEGHCWVGGTETNVRVTSGGVRAEWVKTGDAGTPVYEYAKQDGGYGSYSDMKRGRYVNMWTNYLSKTPLIRRYVKYISESE